MKRLTMYAGAFLLSTSAAYAQVPLTALSLQATSHDQLINWQERQNRTGAIPEILRIEGHVLVDLRAVFDGPWSDTVQRLNVNTSDIRLVLPDGRELPPVGGQAYWGQYDLMSRSLSGSRPNNFPTQDEDLYWNALFRVPVGTTSATLRIAGTVASFSAPVTIPAVSAPVDPASFASFRITGTRLMRRVDLSDGRGDTQMTSSITAPAGYVLAEIELEVSARTSNEVDDNRRFYWNTHNFTVVDNAGRVMGSVGERFMERILDWQFNGVDVGDSAKRTMLWVVPEGTSELRILLGETEVARASLTGVPVAESD